MCEVKRILIISEGSPGHESQSKGFVYALKRYVDIEVTIIPGKMILRGCLRPLFRFILSLTGFRLSNFFLRKITMFTDVPDGLEKPDLIISSGGKSVFVARVLATRYKVNYCYIGEYKPYGNHWFDTIITPVISEPSEHIIEVNLLPVFIDECDLKYEKENNLWCMLIGGASRSHNYLREDWIALAKSMNELSSYHSIRWLITTSRRTGEEAESILQQQINPEYISDAVWWSERPQKKLRIFMMRASSIFVTQDSLTMVTEALSMNKPVHMLHPDGMNELPSGFLGEYYKKLINQKYICRQTFSSLRKNDLFSKKSVEFEDNIESAILACFKIWNWES